ncbi:MAG: DUF4340 domain-containing protein [Deltaproteobacteria bacterium]|nr:DUF4340 domain-containing protein [Deltaproteobacteria bacterium]
MNQLNKILLGLFVAQALLLLGMQMNQEEPLSVKTVQVFPGLDPEQITKLEIVGAPEKKDGPPQNKVLLTKVNGKWGLGDADDFPADGKKVDDLVKNLAKLTSRTTVLQKATYHDKLEVSAEKFQRKVTLTVAGKDQTFYVGTSPSFKTVHLRLDGKDEVYLVNELSTGDLGDRAYTWVDRTYLKFGADQLWSIKLKNGVDQLTLEKNPVNNEWAVLGLTEPVAKTQVDDLVRKAGTVNLEAPVGKADKPEYGLNTPKANLELVTGTSTIAGTPPLKTTVVTWAIGNKLEKENQYYAKASTSDYVVRLASWAVEPLLNKGKKDLVEKKPEAPKATPPKK